MTPQKLPTTYCYIRVASFRKLGTHRIGAIALGSTGNPDTVRVSWSLCNPKDQFNKQLAVRAAVSRLNSSVQSVELPRNRDTIITKSGILEAINKHRPQDERIFIQDALDGALTDLA